VQAGTDADGQGALLDLLRDLADLMAVPSGVEGILRTVGERCSSILPVDGVGVLLRDESGGLQPATADTDVGWQVEELEARLREGPCTDAQQIGRPVAAPDLAQALDRYPRFAPAAQEIGIHSVHGVPMTFRADIVGTFNLVARQPVPLDREQLGRAQMLADVTTSYLVNSRAHEEATRLAEQLRTALDTRVVIEQAKGVLIARHGLEPVDAFEVLRRHSRSNRIPVRSVAADVVEGRLDLPADVAAG
jgi:transcriptional regulator with GAF, ATPase, and Fis domain